MCPRPRLLTHALSSGVQGCVTSWIALPGAIARLLANFEHDACAPARETEAMLIPPVQLQRHPNATTRQIARERWKPARRIPWRSGRETGGIPDTYRDRAKRATGSCAWCRRADCKGSWYSTNLAIRIKRVPGAARCLVRYPVRRPFRSPTGRYL